MAGYSYQGPRSGHMMKWLNLLTIRDHTLGLGGRELGADELDQHLDCKSVREHQGFSAAIGGGSEQFEGASAVGLGRPVTTAAGIKHWSSGGGGSNSATSRIPRHAVSRPAHPFG